MWKYSTGMRSDPYLDLGAKFLIGGGGRGVELWILDSGFWHKRLYTYFCWIYPGGGGAEPGYETLPERTPSGRHPRQQEDLQVGGA